MNIRHRITHGLAVAGLGGALASSSILAGVALLLAVLGGYAIWKKEMPRRNWDTPKELRLLHFAFWFFVLVSLLSWAFEGFEYEGGKTLGTHARLILFWPIAIALIAARVRATTVFSAFVVGGLVVIGLFALHVIDLSGNLNVLWRLRFGAGINPIQFGNLAMLTSLLCLIGGFYFKAARRGKLAIFAVIVGLATLAIALMSQTRSNLIALPAALALLLFLIPRKLIIPGIIVLAMVGTLSVMNSERFTNSLDALVEGNLDKSLELRLQAWKVAGSAFVANPLLGAGLSGYHEIAEAQESKAFRDCCTDHAHNDTMQQAATKGLPGILSWIFLMFIPLVTALRLVRSGNLEIACLAGGGAMIPASYLIFGLTEATLDRSLFLTFYLLSVSATFAALFNALSASYTRQRAVKVSATVITKDEEDHIVDCLKSARLIADEIIVLDSGSSDRTVELARQYADVVEQTDWPGFGIQKQRALERATGDWVLSIDADERITPELAREINHTLADARADAYKLPWAVTIYGKRLDFGRSGRAPLRLFRKEGVRFSDALVHEKILLPRGRVVKTMRGRLTHYTHRNFGHALEKSAKYAWLGSQQKYRRGKRTRSLIYPTIRGIMTFVQVYFIRFGFLDGAVGYLVAVTYAQGSFNKYAGLWTLTRTERRMRG
ncbi:glycosyl transferase [Marinobacter vulgaris]|uniref:Glycosyl transferase n=1 Tax=Marinobacter vulgaris TaxID=1928331 RepID=A0A2V3ZFK0_9GAMM|nr:O-antigen ligase family protein [Marinobacter vulgaris]PXX89318.1 glycosyl transferase [Marinobacter vulgaris]TSJ68120.1 glycosyltransferase [Marinobacter vulgaris]